MSTTRDGKPRPGDPLYGAVTGCAALTVFALVTVVFAVLRLAGAVDWPWWVVTAPPRGWPRDRAPQRHLRMVG